MADGDTCARCGEVEDTRPYGPGGTQICMPCVRSDPQLEATVVSAFLTQLDAAVAMVGDGGIVIMDAGNGPVPYVLGDIDGEQLPSS